MYDKATCDGLARLISAAILRADGGFGGPTSAGVSELRPAPEREPDVAFDMPVLPQVALLYRLLGDYNPLHCRSRADARCRVRPADPARGLCTFGIAGYTLVRAVCDSDPQGLSGMSVRFSAPAYPGETIRTGIWLESEAVCFRARAVERDVVVLKNGVAALAGNWRLEQPATLAKAGRSI